MLVINEGCGPQEGICSHILVLSEPGRTSQSPLDLTEAHSAKDDQRTSDRLVSPKKGVIIKAYYMVLNWTITFLAHSDSITFIEHPMTNSANS